jgi:DNA-binding MarR family transcriptional regulator
VPQAPPNLSSSLDSLHRATARVRERFRAHAARHGLDWSGYAVLRPLVETGPQRITDLADAVQLSPSTVSRTVTQLIGAGLVERRADAVDGRASIVTLTDRGRQAYQELRRIRDDYLDTLLDRWSARDRADLAQLLSRLAAAIEADAGHPATGPPDLYAPDGDVRPGPQQPRPRSTGSTDLASMGNR